MAILDFVALQIRCGGEPIGPLRCSQQKKSAATECGIRERNGCFRVSGTRHPRSLFSMSWAKLFSARRVEKAGPPSWRVAIAQRATSPAPERPDLCSPKPDPAATNELRPTFMPHHGSNQGWRIQGDIRGVLRENISGDFCRCSGLALGPLKTSQNSRPTKPMVGHTIERSWSFAFCAGNTRLPCRCGYSTRRKV